MNLAHWLHDRALTSPDAVAVRQGGTDLTYAGLDRDVAVIGAGTRVEIWDLAAWETYLAEQESGYADTAEEVFPHGPF